MVTLVNSLTDDQVGLLARFYYLTREKTEQDAQLYAVQQTESEDALAQAKAQVADLLAQLQSQIQQTYSELATINPGCETLCQVAYASVPGWCAYNQYAIPDWYYNNGCYVGPVYSAGYCGAYAVPVYNAFYNRAATTTSGTAGYTQHRQIDSTPVRSRSGVRRLGITRHVRTRGEPTSPGAGEHATEPPRPAARAAKHQIRQSRGEVRGTPQHAVRARRSQSARRTSRQCPSRYPSMPGSILGGGRRR